MRRGVRLGAALLAPRRQTCKKLAIAILFMALLVTSVAIHLWFDRKAVGSRVQIGEKLVERYHIQLCSLVKLRCTDTIHSQCFEWPCSDKKVLTGARNMPFQHPYRPFCIYQCPSSIVSPTQAFLLVSPFWTFVCPSRKFKSVARLTGSWSDRLNLTWCIFWLLWLGFGSHRGQDHAASLLLRDASVVWLSRELSYAQLTNSHWCSLSEVTEAPRIQS